MKYLNKISLLFAFIFIGFSCDLTDLDQLDNPNAVTAANADVDLYFNEIQVSFASYFNGTQGTGMQLARMTAMFGNNYQSAYSPNGFNWRWNMAYASLFPDIDAMNELATEKKQFFHVGAAKIMKAYVLQSLVDTFGNVPYSEALKGVDNPSPKADDASALYTVVGTLLDEAIAHLNDGSSIGSPKVDIFYGGSKAKWITLANTMKMRLALATGDGAGVTAAIGAGVIDSHDENFVFQYGSNRSNPNSRHPWYSGAYESSSWSYLSNYYMWEMHEEKAVRDPRIRFYFKRQDLDAADENQFTLDCVTNDRPGHYYTYTNAYGKDTEWPYCLASNTTHINPTNAGGYWGRDHGNNDGIPPDGQKRTAPGIYPAGGEYDTGNQSNGKGESHTWYKGTTGAGGDGIDPILTSSFVHFMRAEAALTLGTGEDARVHLDSAMSHSMAYVKATAERIGGDIDAPAATTLAGDLTNYQRNVDNYKASVLTAYDAVADKLNIVVKEYRLALWGNGNEAWNVMRRTGKPMNAKGAELQWTREAGNGDFPRLFPYPSDYVNLNANATQQAMTTTVFWDKNGGAHN